MRVCTVLILYRLSGNDMIQRHVSIQSTVLGLCMFYNTVMLVIWPPVRYWKLHMAAMLSLLENMGTLPSHVE